MNGKQKLAIRQADRNSRRRDDERNRVLLEKSEAFRATFDKDLNEALRAKKASHLRSVSLNLQ